MFLNEPNRHILHSLNPQISEVKLQFTAWTWRLLLNEMLITDAAHKQWEDASCKEWLKLHLQIGLLIFRCSFFATKGSWGDSGAWPGWLCPTGTERSLESLFGSTPQNLFNSDALLLLLLLNYLVCFLRIDLDKINIWCWCGWCTLAERKPA